MRLNSKRRVLIPITLIILCIMQITCFALTIVPNETCEKDSSEITTLEQSITTDTETQETETGTTETTTQIEETTNSKDTNQDVTTNHVTTDINIASKPSNTEDDLFYLAAAICQEAGGESEEMQLLVANVIINRVNSPFYPNTIYKVLTQPGQYGTMHLNGVSFPSWATKEIKERCYNVASRILNGERYCPENVLYQAEFKQGSGVYKEIDGMYFCYY